jgi:hypothetical protein
VDCIKKKITRTPHRTAWRRVLVVKQMPANVPRDAAAQGAPRAVPREVDVKQRKVVDEPVAVARRGATRPARQHPAAAKIHSRSSSGSSIISTTGITSRI